jgi:membrane associated rhomboid family serine protease
MGISSRSYGRPRFQWTGDRTPRGIKTLLIVMTAVFIAQTAIGMIWGDRGTLLVNYWFGLVPLGVVKGLRIWQPFTYIFLHGGLWHILINLLFLWMFGCDVERAWGTRRFYNYFFLCGVGAGIIDVIASCVPALFGREISSIPTIGASGAIFGVMIAAAVMFPDRQVNLILPPVNISMRVYVWAMVAIEFFVTLTAPGDSIAHFCHLGGIAIGYLYLRRGSFLFNMRNSMSDWKQRRLRRKFEVYMRDHQDRGPSDRGRWVN